MTTATSPSADLIARIAQLEAENKRLHDLCYSHDLSGLSNLRAYEEALPKAWAQAIRGKEAIALLYVDLDKLKQLNDTQGHDAGDRAIKAIARILKKCMRRGSDAAFHLHGDEFTAILPATEAVGLAEVADAIVKTARKHGLSVSVGGCSVRPVRGSKVATLEATADTALYQAKEGRDRYFIAE